MLELIWTRLRNIHKSPPPECFPPGLLRMRHKHTIVCAYAVVRWQGAGVRCPGNAGGSVTGLCDRPRGGKGHAVPAPMAKARPESFSKNFHPSPCVPVVAPHLPIATECLA